ncbi:uncharacterized protein NECHADRAFT_84619 [Fusarium vanettenii 77-13-4]|uniref:Uncharacterized protein n=1 Tax=Fusarium vanettenii (strain ATCC MYA-4622 / CBS 123669 / FGSC 9596 / NRRL 45880 / 77-13-4) TaxID=660122 RepID=C7YTL0_FUSV7|nr:uncharacterized protein NECHADRAFT_84619 [Fusarium vanettenii 77-13-4]EEU44262.1 predicted protein [Fusarium vanettenii 77-13-4]
MTCHFWTLRLVDFACPGRLGRRTDILGWGQGCFKTDRRIAGEQLPGFSRGDYSRFDGGVSKVRWRVPVTLGTDTGAAHPLSWNNESKAGPRALLRQSAPNLYGATDVR